MLQTGAAEFCAQRIGGFDRLDVVAFPEMVAGAVHQSRAMQRFGQSSPRIDQQIEPRAFARVGEAEVAAIGSGSPDETSARCARTPGRSRCSKTSTEYAPVNAPRRERQRAGIALDEIDRLRARRPRSARRDRGRPCARPPDNSRRQTCRCRSRYRAARRRGGGAAGGGARAAERPPRGRAGESPGSSRSASASHIDGFFAGQCAAGGRIST